MDAGSVTSATRRMRPPQPRYRMIDLFLILVDRDGDEGRTELAAEREREHGGRLCICLAIDEIEVWLLAPHRETLQSAWSGVRADARPKESFAEPFLAKHAPKGSPGRGRAWAMRALDRKTWPSLLKLCAELDALKQKLAPLVVPSRT